MIDPFDPELLSLADAAASLPSLKDGQPIHVTTLWRWARYGLRGIKLETTKIGGRVFTNRRALQVFFADVAKASSLRSSRPQQQLDEKHEDAIEAELQRRFGI